MQAHHLSATYSSSPLSSYLHRQEEWCNPWGPLISDVADCIYSSYQHTRLQSYVLADTVPGRLFCILSEASAMKVLVSAIVFLVPHEKYC